MKSTIRPSFATAEEAQADEVAALLHTAEMLLYNLASSGDPSNTAPNAKSLQAVVERIRGQTQGLAIADEKKLTLLFQCLLLNLQCLAALLGGPRRTETDFAHWERGMAAFESMKESLLDNPDYRDRFVALKDGVIVAVDADEFALVERVHRDYPHDPIFVGQVVRELPVVEMSSPEVLTV